jgi:hypothetical protein
VAAVRKAAASQVEDSQVEVSLVVAFRVAGSLAVEADRARAAALVRVVLAAFPAVVFRVDVESVVAPPSLRLS